jgi:glutathione S-transferase
LLLKKTGKNEMENTLYIFPPENGLLSSSPFCAKVEIFLKINNLPYKTVAGNPMKSKKGKLPTLQDSAGKMVDDSRFILKHLINKNNLKIDEHLNAEEKAKGHAMQRLCEESLYFPMLYFTFIDDRGFGDFKKTIEKTLPPVIKQLIIPLIRKNVRKSLHGQGTGRQMPEEITKLARDDIDSLAALIGKGPFVLGDKPTSYDASIAAFVAAMVIPQKENPILEYAKTKKELVDYNERIQEILKK